MKKKAKQPLLKKIFFSEAKKWSIIFWAASSIWSSFFKRFRKLWQWRKFLRIPYIALLCVPLSIPIPLTLWGAKHSLCPKKASELSILCLLNGTWLDVFCLVVWHAWVSLLKEPKKEWTMMDYSSIAVDYLFNAQKK